MAFSRQNVTLLGGVVLPTSYERVDEVIARRDKSNGQVVCSIRVRLGIWTSKAASDAGVQPQSPKYIRLTPEESAPLLVGTITDENYLDLVYAALVVHVPVNDEVDYRGLTEV